MIVLPDLKNFFTRERIIYMTVIIFLLLGLYLNNYNKNRQIEDQVHEVAYWRDATGNAHATLQKETLEKSELKKKVDSISKVLKIKPKQVISYVKVGAKVDTVLYPQYKDTVIYDTVIQHDTLKVDTIKAYTLHYKDSSFLSIEGTVPAKTGLKVSLNADLSFTEYTKRNKILGLAIGKKKTFLDIGTNNPYISFNNAKGYQLKTPHKLKLRPGIGAGLNYNPITHGFSPGIQLGIYLFKD